jgi:PAS domain S-box-containing protein
MTKHLYSILAKIKAPMQAWFSVSAILVFIGCIGVTSFVSNQLEVLEEESIQYEFERDGQQVINAIERRLNEYTATLLGGKALFNASEEVSREEWKKYYDTLELSKNYPGIQAFAYSKALRSPQEVQKMISKIHSEGFTDFSIRPNPEGREDVTAIIYIEPLDKRNIQAFGYDMYSESMRHDAMETAMVTGIPQLSGKVTLVQEIDENLQAGTLLYVPVYENSAPVSTDEERIKAHIGFVYAAFRMGDLLTAIIKKEGQHNPIHFSIYDEKVAPENLLYDSPEHPENHDGQKEISETGFIEISGRTWAINMHANTNITQTTHNVGSQIALVTGGFISILIYILLVMTITSKERVQKKAESLTKEITKSERQLKEQNKELTAAQKETEESLHQVQIQSKKAEELRKNAEEQKKAILNIMEDLKNEADNTKKFHQAVEGSTDPIAITTPDLKFLYVNPAWETVTGHDRNDIIGKSPMILVSDKMDANLFSKASSWVQHGDSYHSDDFMFKRKNGTTYNVDFTMYPIMDEEAPVFLVNIHHDITRRKREEVAKSDFVSIASHQLRTPLTTMRWTLEMFRKGKAGSITDKQKELMNDAYQCSLHMAETISSMLMLSKIEAGKLSPQPSEVNLQTLLEEVKDSQKAAHIEKKQEIRIQCFEDPVAYADPALLREVIMNLLSNAIKYTPNGSSISVTAKNQANDSVLIEVSDTGYGIPQKQHNQVFTKFFRADNIINLPESGTGLGLHLAYSLVELLQGKISFLSKENTGTTFSISLPIPPTL